MTRLQLTDKRCGQHKLDRRLVDSRMLSCLSFHTDNHGISPIVCCSSILLLSIVFCTILLYFLLPYLEYLVMLSIGRVRFTEKSLSISH